MTAPDLLDAIALNLSASSALAGDVAVFYCAAARSAFEAAKERLAELERVLLAREATLCVPPTKKGAP
jgi:hypothetical protein